MKISAEMCAQVLTAAGDIASRNESYREAERLYLDALDHVVESYGPNSFQAASLCAHVSVTMRMQGKISESTEYMRRADDINQAHQKAYAEPAILDLLLSL
ncbi:MAG TPA: hypothetical protein V6C76_04915 [Drouetiella sp.]